VPEGVREHFREGIGKRGRELRGQWQKLYSAYAQKYPELADRLERMRHHELPEGWDQNLPTFPADAKGLATRDSSGKVLNAVAQNVPWLMGGSADLATSNKTTLKFEGAGDFQAGEYAGAICISGFASHGMGASVNGLVVSRIRAFAATFFNFSDYMRASIRLAALMEAPSIFIFTHDSIGLGEDGPTHQPIEQLASLRAMPNLIVCGPAMPMKSRKPGRSSWGCGITRSPDTYTASRTDVRPDEVCCASGVAKGAYVLADAPGGAPDVISIAPEMRDGALYA